MQNQEHVLETRQANRDLAKAAGDAIGSLTTIPQERIRVSAHNGYLRLEGRVQSVYQRNLIENVARGVPGVRGISNWLCVEADPAFAEVRASS